LTALVEYILYPSIYTFSLNIKRFLLFLPAVVVLTPIQTAAEELLFRGYILQGLALWTHKRLVLVLISGLLFMIPHLGNPELSAGFFPVALYYFASGCFLCFITLKTNGLEASIGAHCSGVFFSTAVANYSNSVFETESIFFSTDLNAFYARGSFSVMAIIYCLIMFRGGKEEGEEMVTDI
jgi:uncharacterized protein